MELPDRVSHAIRDWCRVLAEPRRLVPRGVEGQAATRTHWPRRYGLVLMGIRDRTRSSGNRGRGSVFVVGDGAFYAGEGSKKCCGLRWKLGRRLMEYRLLWISLEAGFRAIINGSACPTSRCASSSRPPNNPRLQPLTLSSQTLHLLRNSIRRVLLPFALPISNLSLNIPLHPLQSSQISFIKHRLLIARNRRATKSHHRTNHLNPISPLLHKRPDTI